LIGATNGAHVLALTCADLMPLGGDIEVPVPARAVRRLARRRVFANHGRSLVLR
jgi:formyltetrahydrofolate hydrolase